MQCTKQLFYNQITVYYGDIKLPKSLLQVCVTSDRAPGIVLVVILLSYQVCDKERVL